MIFVLSPFLEIQKEKNMLLLNLEEKKTTVVIVNAFLYIQYL